jgi:hypothetical protein
MSKSMSNLSFLDGFCQSALGVGASAHSKPEDDDDDDLYGDNSTGHSAFKITPYEKPQAPGYVNSYNVLGVWVPPGRRMQLEA